MGGGDNMNYIEFTIIIFAIIPFIIFVIWMLKMLKIHLKSEQDVHKNKESEDIEKIYRFDGAEQIVHDELGNEITISGFQKLIKLHDTFKDKWHGRSWYLWNGKRIDVGRGSYVETRCINLMSCYGCKHLWESNIGTYECLLNLDHKCAGVGMFFAYSEKKGGDVE